MSATQAATPRPPAPSLGDLTLAGQRPWLDGELGGGEAWWQKILEQIRSCRVFVLALSDNSIRSQPCRAELEYAKALGLPVSRSGPVASLLTAPISEIQILDYRERTATAGIRLITSVAAAVASRGPLPPILPDPPSVPFAYLLRAARTIGEPSLGSVTQAAVIGQLRHALREEDARARSEAIELLRQLRRHSDCTVNHAEQIDDMLKKAGLYPDPPPTNAASPPPAAASRRHRGLPVLVGALVVAVIAGVAVLLTAQGRVSFGVPAPVTQSIVPTTATEPLSLRPSQPTPPRTTSRSSARTTSPPTTTSRTPSRTATPTSSR